MFHLRALALTTLTAAAGCALDPIGTSATEGGAGTSVVGPGPGSGPTAGTASGPATSSGTSSGVATSSGNPASSGTGGTGPGGAGGDTASGGAGGANGGAGQGGDGQGGAGDGGAGDGGAGDGGAGDGGAGVTSSIASSVSSASSSGAGGPVCGDGAVDAGEECDGEVGCVQCAWVEGCDHGRHVGFVPGGARFAGDTAVAPTTDFGGQCSTSGLQTAPDHLYAYTSGPYAAYVQVVAFADPALVTGLGDPLLSLHPSCVDEAQLTCIFGNTTGGCCVDSADGAANEVLTTTLLPPGSTLTAAVTGYGIDQGTYAIEFRDLRFPLIEPFAAGAGSFTSAGWQYVSSPRCGSGDACMAIPGEGDHPNQVLTSGAFSTLGSGRVFLYWNQWVDNAGANPADRQGIEISTNGGQAWTSVSEQPNGVDDLTDVQRAVELPAAAANAPDVRVRFVYGDGGGADLGWYVDDVIVVIW